jgi:hypothetical protein
VVCQRPLHPIGNGFHGHRRYISSRRRIPRRARNNILGCA